MSPAMQPEAIEILLVEDSPGDVHLTREALSEARVANRLHVVGDGVEAMAFLRRQGKHTQAVRPDLVLLDLNLPRMDGRKVLAAIKDDPELRQIPVIVLTTSNDDADVLRSYNMHANCYLVKPVDVNSFFEQVRSLEEFWLAVVKLPPVQTGSAAA